MAALRNRVASGHFARCLLRNTDSLGTSVHRFPATQSPCLQSISLLHTIGGGRSHMTTAMLGRRHRGVLSLASALSVRQNSSQAPAEMVTTSSPALNSTPSPTANPSPTINSTPSPTANPSPTLEPAPVIPSPIAGQATETAPTALDVLQGVGPEPSLAELGLGSYTPVGLVQNVLEFMHVDLGLPWWAAIVAGTVLARCAVFPIIVKGQREAAKLNNVLPEMTKLTNSLNEAKRSGNKFEYSKAYSEMMMFQKKHDVNPLRGFLVPLVQAPVFISFFIALRKMSYLPVPSMQSGGLWWFTDLTAADPYYILPLAVTGTMFAVLELGAESGVDNPNLRTMKTVFRVMPLVILPLTINFPTAVFTYWLTSNVFSLGQVALLRHPAVRQRLNIPERITHPPAAMPPSEGFIKSIKTGWKNAQLSQQLQERERRIKNHLDLAARGPLRQTFAHNPLQQTATSAATDKTANTQAKAEPSSGKKRPWEETIG